MSRTLIKRKENFITKANIKHNNKYDYSQVIYVNDILEITLKVVVVQNVLCWLENLRRLRHIQLINI
jgi:hypothetical protein